MNSDKRESRFFVILEYCLALFIIINCNTIWGKLIDERIVLIICLILAVLLGIISLKNLLKYKKFFLKVNVIFLCIIIYTLAFLLFNKNTESNLDYIIKFIFIVPSLFIYLSYKSINNDRFRLLIIVSEIMVILSLISLVIYLLGSITGIISANGYVNISWGGQRIIPSYFYLYFETQTIVINGISILRNSGIFTEGPMYNYMLNIALIVQIFIVQNKNIKKILILIITTISTITTTGIIIVSGIIIYKIFSKKNYNLYDFLKKIIFVLLGITILGSASLYFLKDKILSSSNGRGSYAVRQDDIKIGIEVWKEHPFVGIGYGNHYEIKQRMSSIRGQDVGGSSGLMILLPHGGVYLTSFYLLGIAIFGIYALKTKNIDYMIFISIIFILFVVTNIPYNVIMLYMITVGYTFINTNKSIVSL